MVMYFPQIQSASQTFPECQKKHNTLFLQVIHYHPLQSTSDPTNLFMIGSSAGRFRELTYF